jgi:hypothetical protein
MDPKSILVGNVEMWEGQLRQISKVLNEQPSSGKVHKQMRGRFQTDVLKQQKALVSLKESISTGLSLEACWSKFRLTRRECMPVLSECLAFLQGTLARRAGLDAGLCAIADSMLDNLAVQADIAWPRYTMVASEEFFAELSGIIRLRFPEVSIWNLPVVAHEFGHYLAHKIPKDPLQAVLEREPRYRMQLYEHFADLFATFAMGPAFAYDTILLRFDPLAAFEKKSEHPSDAERVWWTLETLRKMSADEGPALRIYDYVVTALEQCWFQAVTTATGGAPTLPEETRCRLANWLEELYNIVSTELQGTRYQGWFRATSLAKSLVAGDLALDRKDSIQDVLNAAWFCRVEMRPDSLAAIGEKAFNMCLEISQRKV